RPNAPAPSWDQAQTMFCSSPEQKANFAAWAARNYSGNPPCTLRGAGEMAPPAQYAHVPRTFQTSVGVQRQIGATMSVEADYIYSRGTNEKFIEDNVNITSRETADGPRGTIGVTYAYPSTAALAANRA